MRRRGIGVLRSIGISLALAGVTVCVVPTGVASAAQVPRWRAPVLTWRPCEGAPQVQCSTLSVPMDWSHPLGPQIDLALTRLVATGPGKPLGTILFNCGGPGCPSAQVLKGAPNLFTPQLRQRFNIVAFDPRDTGESTRVKCGLPSLDLSIPRFPVRKSEYERLVAYNQSLARSCQKMTGAYLMNVGATDVVQDIEGIREALRDGKLNWLGLSYGTMLGAEYAERYPGNIRAMVLDGALDRALQEKVMLTEEASAAENGFTRWAAWCHRSSQCALHGQPVLQIWNRLVADANQSPIPTPGVPNGVNGVDIQNAADERFLLFKEPNALTQQTWASLGQAIVDALAGNATAFAPEVAPPPLSGGRAIECLDFPVVAQGFKGFEASIAAARKLAPDLGGAVQTLRIISNCVGWPQPSVNPRHVLHIKGVPPTLIVNSTHDPSTPYIWARKLQAQIPRSVLLTRDGDGHTSYLTSPCAQAVIDRYLISLVLPRPGDVCHD
jgi:pimeloyl-ACP methyl ester carboxylesterase